MANASAKLDFRELYQLKWLLGEVVALLSLWTVFYLAIDGKWLIAVAIGLIGLVLLFPRLPGYVPPLAWKVLPVLLSGAILVDFLLAGADFIPPLVRMIVLLLLFRALEYRRRRQDQQLVLLGLFVVVMTGVLTMELSFALQILLFTPAAMLLLFLVTLSECQGGEEEVPEAPWAGFRWGHFLRRLRAALDRRLLLFGGALFLGLAASAGLLFVTLPRFELGQALPFLRLQAQQSLTGFSESIEFNDVTAITNDNAVAFRADVTGERPAESPYWRLLALDEYHGRGFRLSAAAQRATRVFSEYLLEVDRAGGAADIDNIWTVYFEGGISRYLPLPGSFASLRFQSRQDLGYNSLLHTLALREVPGSVLFYQMRAVNQSPLTPAAPGDAALLDAAPLRVDAGQEGGPPLSYPQTTLAVPEDAATRAILDTALAEITGNEELAADTFARRATDWLQARHSYSVTSRIPEGEGDPLARWIASEEGGHCELFAGALVLLARQAGYPARLVTGFRGGDWNGYENYYMVRNANAHAWVEIFSGPEGWLRVDPTPGSATPGQTQADGLGSGGGGSIDRTFGAYLDSLRVLWYRRIVNFDQRQQREMVAGVREQLRGLVVELKERLTGGWNLLRDFFAGKADGSRLIRGLGALILPMVLAGLLWLLWRRSRGWGWRSRARIGGVRRRAGRWLQRLAAVDRGARTLPVYAELLVLRYDDPGRWPAPESVFKAARRARRER